MDLGKDELEEIQLLDIIIRFKKNQIADLEKKVEILGFRHFVLALDVARNWLKIAERIRRRYDE